MKKILCAFVFVCCLYLSACDVSQMSSLQDISKPYVGEYQCESLTLAGQNMKELYNEMKLSLRYYGDFIFCYRDKEGRTGGFDGKYAFHQNSITLSSNIGGKEVSRDFPYENGIIYVRLQLCGKLLCAEFST